MPVNAAKQPLTNLQLELLELYAHHVSDDELMEIKLLLSNYYAQKAMQEADKVWNEKGYDQNTMNEWLNTHMRTPYKKQSPNV